MLRLNMLVAVFAFSLLVAPRAWSQSEVRTEILQANVDGFPIHISYYPVPQDGTQNGEALNAPVVVMLHGDRDSRFKWNNDSFPRNSGNPEVVAFPELLQRRGYAVITVDLRKHGESVIEGKEAAVQPTDYQAMVLGDMVAVKNFIYDEHQKQRLNMNKMGIIAAESSVPVAVAFAEYDWRQIPYDDAPTLASRTPRGQDVKALVMLSPEETAGRINTARSLTFLRNPAFDIALMFIAGADDRKGSKAAADLHRIASVTNKDADRIELVTPAVKDRGVDLMATPDLRVAYFPVLKFLDDHLKSINSPWRDRRSLLER